MSTPPPHTRLSDPDPNGLVLPWQDPLELARQYAGHETLGLFYAATPEQSGSQRSLLVLNPVETVFSWPALEAALKPTKPAPSLLNSWFGYLGYESLENPSQSPPAYVSFPALWMTRFGCVYEFDHTQRKLRCFGPPPPFYPSTARRDFEVTHLSSNMSQAEYLQHIEATLEKIRSGEFYQANITRKFFGSFSEVPAPFSLYEKLCDINPAPYSAFLKIGDGAVLSSSPECFLRIDNKGYVETFPIKGTARKSDNEATNIAVRNKLAESIKDKAENLMIVDLMRHDLARSCIPGSVCVDELFSIHEFSTLFHMISKISGQKRSDVSTLRLIRECFPPGSMTGAPKHRVLEWCRERERMQRGVYSGAMGWIGPDGTADLNVIIRTLLLKDTQFEFQMGGGIVSDSQPLDESEEVVTKASALVNALGLNTNILKNIIKI